MLLIVILLAAIWGFTPQKLPKLDLKERWVTLAVLICGWTVVAALFSMNHLVSIEPTVRVFAYALMFAVTVTIMRTKAIPFAAFVIPAAIVNAAIYVLQETGAWQPFAIPAGIEPHLTRTALIGNPNDVGSYFVAPALVATALALASRRGRVIWSLAAVVIVGATFVTQTVAAIGAVTVGVVVMLALSLRKWWARIVVAVVIAAIGVSAFLIYAPLRERAASFRAALARRDFDTLSASRLIPFATASAMLRDHPVMGVGPGNFAYQFFDYKLRAQERHRSLFQAGGNDYNYGEVHNDHLQVAAETGFVGYGLFVAALIVLAAGSWQRAPAEDGANFEARHEYVRLLSLPLALSFAALALAQFPLELVAPTCVYLWAAASVVAWRKW